MLNKDKIGNKTVEYPGSRKMLRYFDFRKKYCLCRTKQIVTGINMDSDPLFCHFLADTKSCPTAAA